MGTKILWSGLFVIQLSLVIGVFVPSIIVQALGWVGVILMGIGLALLWSDK